MLPIIFPRPHSMSPVMFANDPIAEYEVYLPRDG